MQVHSPVRQIAAVVLVWLLALPATARTPSAPGPVRVRITGPVTYAVPGVWRFEGNSVIGRSVIADRRFVQYQREDGRVLTILRPSQRMTGNAKGTASSLLDFVPDEEGQRLYIPFDAITRVEVSRHRGQLGRSVAGGVYTGVGIVFGTWIGLMRYCEDTCSDRLGYAIFVTGIATAIAAGALVGRKVRGQRWETISIDELRAILNPHQVIAWRGFPARLGGRLEATAQGPRAGPFRQGIHC
jgi:hypothetical protein